MEPRSESSEAEERLVVAELGPAHGIRGEISGRLAGVEPEWLRGRSGVVLRGKDGRETPVVVEEIRSKKSFWILRLNVLRDREGAEANRDSVLMVSRDELPELENEEWYVADLVGLSVETESGEGLGFLEEVLKLPANDVFVVRGVRGEILLPVIDDVVRSVDLQGKRVVVQLLPGLLDEEDPGGSGQ